MKLFAVVLLLCGQAAFAGSPTNSFGDTSDKRANVDWKRMFNQLFYWNIQKNPVPETNPDILAKNPSATVDTGLLLRHSLYYSPNDFNQDYVQIVKGTTDDAYNKREQLKSYRSNHALYESASVANDIQSSVNQNSGSQAASVLLQTILSHRADRVDPSVNYFATPVGQAVAESLKDVLFVVIPGFASHTIADYSFAELVEDANLYYGRPRVRVVPVDGTPTAHDQLPEIFYQPKPGPWCTPGANPNNPNCQNIGFDVVHPMGYELGNSMGTDKEAALNLAKFIKGLPPVYASKKIILFGYSKGCSIAHRMVELADDDLRNRVMMISTIAGVNQGALPAEDGMNQLTDAVNAVAAKAHLPPVRNAEEAIRRINDGQDGALAYLSPFLAQLFQFIPANAILNKFSETFGFNLGDFVTGGLQLVSTQENQKILEGVYDMSVFNKVRWNLSTLNDQYFKHPISIFNLSVISNIQDFALPGQVFENGERPTDPPSIVPQIGQDGKMNWNPFYRDNVFLYFTSYDPFKRAKGGLFDTQVAWLDTKGMALDQRPLSASLRPRELAELARQFKETLGYDLPANFATMPRKDLIRQVNAERHLTMNNLNFIDLGDLRGTHWDVSFRNVYKPGHNHTFPRKAMLTALIETLAVYNSANKGN